MACRECGSSLVDGAEFCHQCGVRRPHRRGVTNQKSKRKSRRRSSSDVDVAVAPKRRRKRREQWQDRSQQIRGAAADREVTLWSGTYSGKAMINYWLAAIAATVVLPLFTWRMTTANGSGLGGTVTFLLVALWLGLIAFLAFRKIDVHYELTNQRLIHKFGILRRVTNRIEVIDIDDIVFDQGIVERILGVGTIEIISSDESDPLMVMDGIDDVFEVAQIIDEARRVERIRRGIHIESV